MSTSLNMAGIAHARSLMAEGKVDKSTSWSFSIEDEDELLGPKGDDWEGYGKWHLVTYSDHPSNSKNHYGHPFGKKGVVYQSALAAIRLRCSEQGLPALESLSGKLLGEVMGKSVPLPRVYLRPKQLVRPPLTVKEALNCVQHAYSTLEVKEANDVTGVLFGTASTPTTDTQGDIMEPSGAQYALPLPLLWQHNAKQPIGHVIAARVHDGGIEVTAKIARGVAPFIDEAWNLIKAGLVRGFSIGFRGLEAEPVRGKAGRGLHYRKWSWVELSAVTLPANLEATIVSIKSLDEPYLRAAFGDPQRKGVVRLDA